MTRQPNSWMANRPPIYAELVQAYDLDPTELPAHDLAALLANHPTPIRDQHPTPANTPTPGHMTPQG